MFRSILAPYDGTAFARDGLLRALRIAVRSSARLHIVHVGSKTEHVVTDLYSIASECRAHSNVDVSVSMEIGPVADALAGYARRNKVDLIVLSSHGRGGVARVWLGSVADRLIRETSLPVLVARSPSIATAALSSTECRRILLPLDGSALAEQSIIPAVFLALAEDAEITLLMVVPEQDQIEDGVLQAARGRAAAHDVQSAEWYLDRVVSRFAALGASFDTSVVIARDVPSAIISFAEHGDFDIVAMATHGRGGIARLIYGSVADRVVRESLISTLVIHPTAREALKLEEGYQLRRPSLSANAT